MMIGYDLENIKEVFARLFVLAIGNKTNLSSFTSNLLKSDFLYQIENDIYDDSINRTFEDIFYSITGFNIIKDGSLGIYNASFKNVAKIAKYFDANYSLFLERLSFDY